MKYKIKMRLDQRYAAYFKRWWWPFWMQCFLTNRHDSIEHAMKCCEIHAGVYDREYDPYNAKLKGKK